MLRKNKKVLISLSIACSLLLSQAAIAETAESTSSSASVYEEIDQIKPITSKNKAIEIIKGFKFAEGLKMSEIRLENSREFNQPVWKMDFYSPDYPTEWGVSISGNTGELLNYYFYQRTNSKKNIINVSKKKAKEAADKFLADYIKPGTGSLEYLGSNSYPISGGITVLPKYQFTYALKVNGIRTSNINYTVSIDATNGKVTNFSSPYGYVKETKYPSTEGVKDQNQLRDKYISLLGMQLQYRITYGDNYIPKARIDYIPTMAGWLNAKTLDSVDADYITYYGNVSSLTNKYAPINPDAKVEKKEINENKAIEIIKNAKVYVESLCDFKFNGNPNLTRSPMDKEFFSGYSLMTDNKNYSLYMSLNLSTGNITGLDFTYQNFDSNKSNGKEALEKVNYNDAKKISDGIIKKLFAKQFGVFSDNNQQPSASNAAVKQQKNHIFQYVRYENGIPTDNSISACIDKETGKPSSVSMRWNDIEFPKADNIISTQAAKEALLNYVQLSLEYYTPNINRTEALDTPEEAVIVFKPNDGAMNTFIDAGTGKIIDYYGTSVQVPYVDENHWAADNIDMLQAQGVIINSISKCDESLSRQDAVKMFSQVMRIMGIQYLDVESLKKDSFSDVNKENEYYKYIETTVQNGIIKATGKKFNGTQKITKGEYIIMLLDMLGYKEIAKNNKLSSNSDINAYILKCKSLDILPVKPGNKFNYKETITFAEAAYSLQKALKFYK